MSRIDNSSFVIWTPPKTSLVHWVYEENSLARSKSTSPGLLDANVLFTQSGTNKNTDLEKVGGGGEGWLSSLGWVLPTLSPGPLFFLYLRGYKKDTGGQPPPKFSTNPIPPPLPPQLSLSLYIRHQGTCDIEARVGSKTASKGGAEKDNSRSDFTATSLVQHLMMNNIALITDTITTASHCFLLFTTRSYWFQ